MNSEQLGRLLHKARRENRKSAKSFLKFDCGLSGSAEELDRYLAMAESDPVAVAEADRLDRQRTIAAKTIDVGVDGRVAEMLADIRLRMQDIGMTQTDVASACGFSQPLMSDYLSGRKLPGAANLAKIASAVGCVWRLTSVDEPQQEKSE